MDENEPPTTPKKSKHPQRSISTTPIPFPTPRRRKTPAPSPVRSPAQPPWPRLKRRVSRDAVADATEKIFGYRPRQWQLEVMEKALEGNDCIVIAGTGSGKSLVYALLAIAAELAQGSGTVIVVCPLKSLQEDQVRRFDRAATATSLSLSEPITPPPLHIRAVAINEDNKDDSLFNEIQSGVYRIVYASPECLLRSQKFKQLFRDPAFRLSMIALAVDEAHVIQTWAKTFRKDYAELQTLRIIIGSEIPSVALTATCSTETFETIYESLRMGTARNFYGIDMGSNRPNLSLWVRPTCYSATSLSDLLAFLPTGATKPEDFGKTIFYFKTRKMARRACDRLCAFLPPRFRNLLYPFTATNSEDYKKEVIERIIKGTARWAFATKALGMGMDIPDIVRVIIFGVDDLSDVMQEGGRAGRSSHIKAEMIWIVEPWALNPVVSEEQPDGNEKVTKKAMREAALREKMDPAAREFINCSQSENCARIFSVNHFTPRPTLPGFPWHASGNAGTASSREGSGQFTVTWIPHKHILEPGPTCGCSALSCRPDPMTPVGLLSNEDKRRIDYILRTLDGLCLTRAAMEVDTSATQSAAEMTQQTTTNARTPALLCTGAEREALKDGLVEWRDSFWAEVKGQNPFLTREWVLSGKNISRLVEKTSLILNTANIDEEFISSVIPKHLKVKNSFTSLATFIQGFRASSLEHRTKEKLQRPAKRATKARGKAAADHEDPFMEETAEGGAFNLMWKVPNYVHEAATEALSYMGELPFAP